MIHTAQFYIKFKEDEKIYLETKYNQNILNVYSNINNIYSCKGIVINYITKFVNEYTMFFTIDFIKLLKKSIISEVDIQEIEKEISNFKMDIINNSNVEVILTRIDYRLDIEVSNNNRETLMYLYKKTLDKYRFKKKFNEYDSTIYFNSKSIQSKVYDKEAERKAKKEIIEDYEKNILRFEVALRNQHLNYNKRTYNIPKNINAYLKSDICKNYMEKSLGIFLFKGDYYTIYKAKKIINNSLLKKSEKEAVIEFIKCISKNGVTNTQGRFTKYKFKKYIAILEELNINPILIPKNLEGAPSFIENPFKLCA